MRGDSIFQKGYVHPKPKSSQEQKKVAVRHYLDHGLCIAAIRKAQGYLFKSIEQVQHITEEWLREYNEQRPHDALGGLPPRRFMPRLTTVADSSNALSA